MIVVFGGVTGGLGKALVDTIHEGSVCAIPRSTCDLEQEASISRFFGTLADIKEELHLINATGLSRSSMLHKTSLEDFEKTWHVNVMGSFLLLKHSVSLLKSRPGSTVTLFSSIVPRMGVVGTSAYAASKSALAGLVKIAALEMARYDVRVNALELGYFDYGMIKQVPQEMREQVIKDTPLHRLGTADDLWEACRFLIHCRFVTGSVVGVAGGL